MKIVGGQENKNRRRVRTAIFASGSGTNFEAIVNANRCGKINLDINILVYNHKNAKVAERAKTLGIESVFLSHRDYSSRLTYDLAVSKTLIEREIEIVVLAGWTRLLSAEFLQIHTEVLNIHPSILPAFPGLGAIKKAYIAQVVETGCTVHRVIQEMDAGPIVAQAFVKTAGLDLVNLKKQIQTAEHILYPRAIATFVDDVFSEKDDSFLEKKE